MTRRITINVDIEKKIRAVAEDIDLDAISVFETIAIDNQPVNKPGSLYDGGVLRDSLLSEMRDFIAAGNGVPLIELHEERLPVGKVFEAQLVQEQEKTSLHVLFYVPRGSELERQIELGIIDSVSVGVLPKKILCSECGWDYMSEEATWDNLWNRTCENGHTIGVDGVHIVAEGLGQFRELSLVMKGASPKAKILPKSKQVIGKEVGKDWVHNQLAASDLAAEVFMLTASRRETTMSDKKNTQPEATSEVPSAEKVLLSEMTAKNVELTATAIVKEKELTELKEKLAATQKELDEVKTSLDNKVAKEDHDKAMDFLKAEAKVAITASGISKEVPEKVEDLVALFTEAKQHLVNNFPIGGKSDTSVPQEKTEMRFSALNAYTARN